MNTIFRWGQSIISDGGMGVLFIQEQLFNSWYTTEQVYFQNWIDISTLYIYISTLYIYSKNNTFSWYF